MTCTVGRPVLQSQAVDVLLKFSRLAGGSSRAHRLNGLDQSAQVGMLQQDPSRASKIVARLKAHPPLLRLVPIEKLHDAPLGLEVLDEGVGRRSLPNPNALADHNMQLSTSRSVRRNYLRRHVSVHNFRDVSFLSWRLVLPPLHPDRQMGVLAGLHIGNLLACVQADQNRLAVHRHRKEVLAHLQPVSIIRHTFDSGAEHHGLHVQNLVGASRRGPIPNAIVARAKVVVADQVHTTFKRFPNHPRLVFLCDFGRVGPLADVSPC
mmetsp:Transcript_146529/g.470068  ORF Transcript_146529/g.470068 Transcript_146529/m.470068 type:complete len:264 (+) Transcript_146529:1008-1799(+)